MHFIPLKKGTSYYSKYTAIASSAFLHLFFNSNSVSFVEGGARIFFAPERRVPYSYATAHQSFIDRVYPV